MASVFANFGCSVGLQGFANWLDIVGRVLKSQQGINLK